MNEPHQVNAEHAPKIWDWLQNRGGLAIWRSINLSNPEASWTCPLNDEHDNPKSKPSWESANEPERVITDPAEVVVIVPKEVKRFHVAVRPGSQGLSLKVTDGGTRRIRQAVAKAAEKYGDAWYDFDYGSYENVVILAPDSTLPLVEWMDRQ